MIKKGGRDFFFGFAFLSAASSETFFEKEEPPKSIRFDGEFRFSAHLFEKNRDDVLSLNCCPAKTERQSELDDSALRVSSFTSGSVTLTHFPCSQAVRNSESDGSSSLRVHQSESDERPRLQDSSCRQRGQHHCSKSMRGDLVEKTEKTPRSP